MMPKNKIQLMQYYRIELSRKLLSLKKVFA